MHLTYSLPLICTITFKIVYIITFTTIVEYTLYYTPLLLDKNTVMLAIICSFSCKWEQNGTAADLCLKNSTMLQFCVCESAQDPQQNISLQS